MNSDGRSYRSFLRGIPNSYALVFFSDNQAFAWILMAVTFFDVLSGLAGLIAIITANLVAWLAGLNLEKIRRGYYGFNALLVGLGLGLFYEASPEFFLILLFSALFTLFITLALEGVIGKYYLPYLSIPFILGIWITFMATREYNYLEVSQRGVFALNEMYVLGGPLMVKVYDWFNNTGLPQSLVVYFRSLGAILFQYHLFPGLLIALGLLIYSRIAFLLSLLGFYSAFVFYQFVGADMTTLSYTYIGFNFILTAIAIGGFFIIPSWYSFLWVILLTPITSILLTAFKIFFLPFQLSIYSLPFNIITLTFLYALKFRERHLNKPELVTYQLFSPEKNLYHQHNNRLRFGRYPLLRSVLPFWGEWSVTQGHEGPHTHKDRWRHAWDFEIRDGEGKSYRNHGNEVSDYYCYNKPVLAVADGWVEEIIDQVKDNAIGQVNLEHNWGNTVVIRHGEGLYSAISHLKPGSIRVHKGSYLKKGEIIGHCGNSGRSPVPHLHLQFQSTPQVGSATIDVPLSHYILKTGQGHVLMTSEKPAEGNVVGNIEPNDLLREAYNFVPGAEIVFEKTGAPDGEISHWDVTADVYNNTYITCRKTHSKAYFRNDGDMIWFTHFEGSRKSLLYSFFLANYKILFGFYRHLSLTDHYPVHILGSKTMFLQDFIAPFHLFAKATFALDYARSSHHMTAPEITLRAVTRVKNPLRSVSKVEFEMNFREDMLEKFTIFGPSSEPETWRRVINT